MSSGRPCGQQDRDAGRRAHGAVIPNNGCVSAVSESVHVDRPVLPSVTVRAEHCGS